MFHTFYIHHKYLCCNFLAFWVMIGCLVSEQPNLCFVFHSTLIFRDTYVQLLKQALLITFLSEQRLGRFLREMGCFFCECHLLTVFLCVSPTNSSRSALYNILYLKRNRFSRMGGETHNPIKRMRCVLIIFASI